MWGRGIPLRPLQLQISPVIAVTRIRDAMAALPVESAVLDGEAIVMRSADRCDFEALRSRQGQAEAILVAYDIMEADGQDVRLVSAGHVNFRKMRL
jgi:hypothetical protein